MTGQELIDCVYELKGQLREVNSVLYFAQSDPSSISQALVQELRRSKNNITTDLDYLLETPVQDIKAEKLCTKRKAKEE